MYLSIFRIVEHETLKLQINCDSFFYLFYIIALSISLSYIYIYIYIYIYKYMCIYNKGYECCHFVLLIWHCLGIKYGVDVKLRTGTLGGFAS